MSHSQSWTDESGSTPTNSSEDRDENDSSNSSSREKDDRNKLNRDSYKICSEQTIVHRWFLSDIQSLHDKNQGDYFQSSSFGCTGDNGLLQWAIRFHPIAPLENKHSISPNESIKHTVNNSALSEVQKDDEHAHRDLLNKLRNIIKNKEDQSSSLNQLLNEIVPTSIENIEQSKTTEENVEKILNHHALKNLPQDSITSSEEESLSDDKSPCAFEVLRVNVHEPFSQTLFETIYQVFEVSDDGILSLLKTEGRHQVHFNRALITLSRDTIFSVRSNNILFLVKLIIYECSSTVDYWQPMSGNGKTIKTVSSDEPLLSNISSGDASRFCDSNAITELPTGNRFWLMSIQKLFTDIIIRSADGQEFSVHRVILCASCEKFAELIATNQQMNRLEIHSINGIILKRILKYIYTGEIEICVGEFSIDEIQNLIDAADLFDLFQLKNILTKKCLNHITQNNCFDLLKIADDKQMKILKNRILTFLCHQFPQIFNTDLWQNFRNTRSHLYDETFASLIRLIHLQKSIIEQFEEKKPKL